MRTVTEVSIHAKGQNPIFGEFVTKVRLDDAAAGAFLVISQSRDDGLSELRLDYEELVEITDAAKWMMEQPGVEK